MEPRFHQAPFYPQQQHHARSHNRATSPQGRRPFAHDTPSPSRSPASAAMVHNFGVYTQNGFQQQHIMNGGQNHQRYNGMHMPKQQQQQHAFQQSQHHNPQQHGHMGHQPNLSGGPFQTSTPGLHQYGHESLMNGTRDDGLDDEYSSNEFFQDQRRLWEEAKEMAESGTGHHRARQVAQQTKGVPGPFGGPLGPGGDDATVEDKIRSATAQVQNRNLWSELDMGGQGLRALSTSLFRFQFLTRLDIPQNLLRTLPPAIGDLRNLEYLDVSFNELISLPEEIGMLTNLRTLLLAENQHLHELPWSVGYLFKLETLGIYETGYWKNMPEDQKGAFLSGGTKELINHILESTPDEYLPPPNQREWVQIEDPGPSSEENPTDTFKTLTYNILCERYATKQKYGYVTTRNLNWHFRRQLILQEITEVDADVVCLQELDRASYDEFFRKELSTLGGYKGYYAQKSRAETIGDNARYVDGCGTFWKDKKYMVLDTQHLVLGRKALERPGAKTSADMLNRVWQRDDIATVVLLENRFSGSRLIVANCHVYWDPAFKDVKLVQIAVMMEELNRLADKYSKHPAATNKKPSWIDDEQREPGPSLEYSLGSQIPMIICGDFNSAPGSPVYNLMTRQTLDAHHDDFTGRDYGTLSSGGMTHNFTLKSSNSLISSRFITNYTPDFVDELDHIFYSSKSLRPLGVLGQIDQDYLRRVPGFPNQHFPSDHLALVAEFKVEKHRNAQKVEADFGPSSKRS